jgi:hypothetical protein
MLGNVETGVEEPFRHRNRGYPVQVGDTARSHVHTRGSGEPYGDCCHVSIGRLGDLVELLLREELACVVNGHDVSSNTSTPDRASERKGNDR